MTRSHLRVVEGVYWVGVVATTATVLLGVLGLAVNGLLLVKQLLFVSGVLLFGIGSLGFQPKAPYRDSKRITLDSDTEHRFEASLTNLPPLKRNQLIMDERISRNVKIFFVGLCLLGVSAFLEFGLGVHA